MPLNQGRVAGGATFTCRSSLVIEVGYSHGYEDD